MFILSKNRPFGDFLYFLFFIKNFSLNNFVSWFSMNHCLSGKLLPTLRTFQITISKILHNFMFIAFNQVSGAIFLVFIKKIFTLTTVNFNNPDFTLICLHDCFIYSTKKISFLLLFIVIPQPLMEIINKQSDSIRGYSYLKRERNSIGKNINHSHRNYDSNNSPAQCF